MADMDPRRRWEIYLKGIAEPDTSLPDPRIREEMYLKEIADRSAAINGGYIIASSDTFVSKINNAFTKYDTVVLDSGTYTTDQSITVPSNKTLILKGDVTYTGSGAFIKLEDVVFCRVYVHNITAMSGSCIEIKATTAECEFHDIHSVYLYGYRCINIEAANRGVQHVNIYSIYLRATNRAVSMASTGAGWIGEIKMFGGEVNGSSAVGVYSSGQITAFRAFGVGFETLANTCDFSNASEVSMYGCRSESAGKYIFRDTCNSIVISGVFMWMSSVDISNLANTSGISFYGTILGTGGIVIGSALHVTPAKKMYVTGGSASNQAYEHIYTPGTTIGATGNMPVVVRINVAGTYKLSSNYDITCHNGLILYLERAGIVIKNEDESKTLLTTTDAQSVWRVTSAAANNYFSPSGYLVERITPVL